MKINDIHSGMLVQYVGNAPGLIGLRGTVRRVFFDVVEVFFDGRITPSYVRPQFLRRRMMVGGVTTTRREVLMNYGNEYGRTRPLNDGARNESTLPNDSASRKEYPLFDVLFGQFPAAMTAIAHHSFKGNQKHNPGSPLQDNRALSKDDANCILRHLSEGDYEGAAWRACRLLQKKLEQEGAPIAPLATNAIGNY